jgi:hypothetical protein
MYGDATPTSVFHVVGLIAHCSLSISITHNNQPTSTDHQVQAGNASWFTDHFEDESDFVPHPVTPTDCPQELPTVNLFGVPCMTQNLKI